MLTCDLTTRVFTDHRNLLFVFNPAALEPSLGRHKVLKVIRWALYLSSFTYRIEHVAGENNTWPDIMTRWMRGYRRQRHPTARRVSAIPEFSGVTSSPQNADFRWPSLQEIKEAQTTHTASAPVEVSPDDTGLYISKNGKPWIPAECTDLKVRLLTITHAGTVGHRGADATWHILREAFHWTGQRKDVRAFVSSCLLCVMTKSGERVPRPLSSTAHALRPNEIVHFDYLFLGESDDDEKYVLVVKDDLSSYCWLKPCSSANAEHTTTVLAQWIRTFTAPRTWVSDQGSHFKNEVLRFLAKSHSIKHNFSVAYSPWANGTVESLMRPVLAATRAMLGELKLGPQDWPSVIPAISTALNEAPLERLGRRDDGIARCPLEVMTGIRPRRHILSIVPEGANFLNGHTISHARASQLAHIEQLQTALEALHKDVSTCTSTRRAKAIEAHNRATNIMQPSFTTGDLVLVRRPVDRGHKLSFNWHGPCQITDVCSPLVY